VIAPPVYPERLGRRLTTALSYWQGLYELTRYTLGHLRVLAIPPVRLVFLKQIYFTGLEALGALSIIAMLAGIVITTQITSIVGQNAALLAKILLWTLVRELGPLLTALVIIARSSSATASELASMNIRGEITSLRIMGIPPLDYLIVPRVAGMTLSVVAVTFYFQVIAIIVGLAFAALTQNIAFMENLAGVISLLTLTEVLASFLKALAFGLLISLTSCYYGLSARTSVTAIPRAATHAVMRNLILLFVLDGIITYVLFF
jgi:phospholipid/cholesterol/gamma-HCH transport system permease protein